MADIRSMTRLLVPRVPLMLRTAAMNALSLSKGSSTWDMRTEVTVTMLKSILHESTSSVSKTQQFSITDPGSKGSMWVSRTSMPSPGEDDLRQFLFQIIRKLNITGDETFTEPEMETVEVEWQGFRSGVSAKAEEPKGLSEKEKYEHLMKETNSDITILYFHGGAYYTMDPATYRKTVSQLSKLTGARACNVRYRLAPKHAFPTQILDCLLAYLNLLYPAPGSFHEAVKPENVVFAGDSAGGNMCLALLLVILQAGRQQDPSSPSAGKVMFNGNEVSLPLPGGIATNSAWTDVTRAMPSITTNYKYDYLPLSTVSHPTTPAAELSSLPLPTSNPHRPTPCALWPASPARAEMYCDDNAMCHPLVSPLAAPQELWEGAPPLYFLLGEEELADEIRVVARRCARAGVSVTVDIFEAMPHVFPELLDGTPTAAKGRERFARWIASVSSFHSSDSSATASSTTKQATRIGNNTSKGDSDGNKVDTDTSMTAVKRKRRNNQVTLFAAKTLKMSSLGQGTDEKDNDDGDDNMEKLTDLTDEDVKLRMDYARYVKGKVLQAEIEKKQNATTGDTGAAKI